MHSVKEKPYVVDGKIEIRPIMVVALTYDHRLLDGREAVTFLGKHYSKLYAVIELIPASVLVRVKEYIEQPAKMLLTL